MAQLYFKYGAMGSSKTANALMARFNYEERGQKTLLCKPQLDTRDGDHMVHSRIGLEYPCVYFHEMREMDEDKLKENACIIVDEEHFLLRQELRLIDEVLTPDSSRFWPADQYEPGRSQPSFDKQYLRDWLTSQPWDMQPPAPALPAEVVDATARRYREAYHILTGKEFTI